MFIFTCLLIAVQTYLNTIKMKRYKCLVIIKCHSLPSVLTLSSSPPVFNKSAYTLNKFPFLILVHSKSSTTLHWFLQNCQARPEGEVSQATVENLRIILEAGQKMRSCRGCELWALKRYKYSENENSRFFNSIQTRKPSVKGEQAEPFLLNWSFKEHKTKDEIRIQGGIWDKAETKKKKFYQRKWERAGA